MLMVSPLLAVVITCMVGAATAITLVIESEFAANSITSINTSTDALLAFKQAISNDPTNFLGLWNTSVLPDYCDWQGVRCSNGTHDVIALLLDSNQLTGTLPPQLSQLSQLAYLNVSNNSFSGRIPSEFRELSSLTHLDLSFNQLVGSIPSSLANCTRLQYLDFGNNSLSGKFPSFLTSFNDLVYLALSDNSFLGEQIPPDIGRLSNLQFLRLYKSGLTGSLPPSITNCTSLVWLHLNDNNFTGRLPSDWSNLSRIQQIQLPNNSFTGSIPATLGNCTTLIELAFYYNSLTGELPDSLGKLTMLQYLGVFGNSISGAIPPSLVNCTGLTSLQLSHNNLTGHFPSGILGQLKQLESVSFTGNTKLSGRIPETIGDCARLQWLSIIHTEVGGPLPASLYGLSNLQSLRLSSSRFSGSLSESVKNLTALISLFLDSNAFIGRIPAGLGELTELQGLGLHNNHFEGPIPQLWQGTSISTINLSNNFLTGEIPVEFRQLQLLNDLYLQSNHLSGDIPDIFGSLTGLLNLDLSHNNLTGTIHQSLIVSQSLDLSFNNLTGTIPSSLGNMDMVTTIRLAGNHLTGGIPDSLAGCQELQALDLSLNNLEGEIPSTLGLLLVLQNLNLSNNKFYGALPQSLGDLHDLVSLNVSNNALQGMIPSTGIYKNSSAAAFLGNPELCGYPLDKSCISYPHHTRSRTTLIVSICTAVGGVLMILLCICSWWRCSSSATNRILNDESDEEIWFGMQKQGLRAWTAREMRAATNQFDHANVVGSGGVSVCFKGMVEAERKLVAIKMFNMKSQNKREARRSFVQELNILGQVRHRNLVKTLGYCMDEGVVALVLEFMENGNLGALLHNESKSLSWGERLSIAADVAEGLVYLHHESIQRIIHCDLKPENILIGSDMVAKISDFGIARLLDHNQTANFRGTLGYVAPECAAGSHICTKADIYSYGVLLIELVTGMKPTSLQLQEQGITLHAWARGLLESRHIEGLLDAVVQERIEKDNAVLQQLKELLYLGVKCTNNVAKERPNIKEVREALVKFTKAKLAHLDIEALIH